MEFNPIYLVDRIAPIKDTKEYQKNKLNVINPRGNVGVVTLWTPPEKVWNNLLQKFPRLFEQDSPLVALTSLYGNGIPQMLANLVYNPQIKALAITGTDMNVVRSSKYLQGFLQGEIEPCEIGGVSMNRVKGTTFALDAQLRPEMFQHLRVEQFPPRELEKIAEFASQSFPSSPQARIAIKLHEPEFKDFPSDTTNHHIVANTSLEAWMEVMYRIDRFGETVTLGAKGQRRSLFNLDVDIKNAAVDVEQALDFGFSPKTAREYQEQILSGEIPGEGNYGYGNRLRKHWGGDALQIVGENLRKDPTDRYQHISLWDTTRDLIEGNSHPCLTDIYCIQHNGKLMLSAGFRTHNAVSAYLYNLYALRAVQEEISRVSGIEPGQINVRSRWISIDSSEPSLEGKMKKIAERRKRPVDVNDPIGYFVINPKGDAIVAEHYSPQGQLLKRYEGQDALEIKDTLRRDVAVLDPDHSMWIGHQLARAEYELRGKVKDL